MCKELISQYNYIQEKLEIELSDRRENLNILIKDILRQFMGSHKRVAVYCYGYHTQMLFTDFVAELRDIVCIIDNGNVSNDSNFKIIKDADIGKYELDGIVISSFRYKDEIKQGIHDNHKSVEALDLYEELEKRGFLLEHEFYYIGPYHAYSKINSLQIQIKENNSVELLKQLLQEYIGIKDFRLAGDISKRIYKITGADRDKEIHELVEELYEKEINQLDHIGKNNILLLCLDGMRRRDFFQGRMRKSYELLKDSSLSFTNAYSYSTMTYESLVPVFEENSDQRTEYYLREEVEAKNCRFMKKALNEGRFVAIYGDGNHYIYDDRIKYSGNSQTVTEKLWDFVIDSNGIDNGIFYLHELYESHFSFVNPYTQSNLAAQGSAMLFDYLPQNTGRLRTDYKTQLDDALRYLDDTLAPFIEKIPCDIVVFADHGNLVLEQGTELQDILKPQLAAGEEWIRIPLVVRSKQVEIGENVALISLMSLNDIMLSLLSGESYKHKPARYIKIGRSEIYNQQFKELYGILDLGYNGEAFEGFIFEDGYKLIVYSDGRKELFRISDDIKVDDQAKIDSLFQIVMGDITVCSLMKESNKL